MKTRRRNRQASLPLSTHGGARRGAGRKPKGRVAEVTHRPRPRLSGREPVLVTLKLDGKLPSLRTMSAFNVIVASLVSARDRLGMRVIEYSVQRDHLHMLVEATSSSALSHAMQGLAVRLARALNRRLRRRGRVFAERYHGRVLSTPRQVRDALAYVLCNARKHGHAPNVAARPSTWLLRIGWRRAGLLSRDHVPGAMPS